jgi:hypothetical protein
MAATSKMAPKTNYLIFAAMCHMAIFKVMVRVR